MKYRICLIVLVVSLFAGASWASSSFFAVLPDVPVADGVQVLPEQDLVFNKPEARIVETVSLVDQSSQVRVFYQETLPSFGWKRLSDGVYGRGHEVLRFWFDANEGQEFFHLRVEPANQ